MVIIICNRLELVYCSIKQIVAIEDQIFLDVSLFTNLSVSYTGSCTTWYRHRLPKIQRYVDLHACRRSTESEIKDHSWKDDVSFF